jgi:hypothetical protein
MKPIQRTRYPKHRHTYAFDPGVITAPAEPKTEIDPKIINVTILSRLINRHSENRSTAGPEGLMINDVSIMLRDGICQLRTTKFRFTDCYSLLIELVKERVMRLGKDQIKEIQNKLYE